MAESPDGSLDAALASAKAEKSKMGQTMAAAQEQIDLSNASLNSSGVADHVPDELEGGDCVEEPGLLGSMDDDSIFEPPAAAPDGTASRDSAGEPIEEVEERQTGGKAAKAGEGERITPVRDKVQPDSETVEDESALPDEATAGPAAPSGATKALEEEKGKERSDGPSSTASQHGQVGNSAPSIGDESTADELQPPDTRFAPAPAPKSVSHRVAQHRELAWKLLGEGDTPGALQELNDALGLGSQSPSLYSSRALVHLQADRVPEAISDLEESLRLGPHDPKIFVQLANLCIGGGDTDKALSVMRRGHTLHPSNTELVDLLSEYGINLGARQTVKERESGAVEKKDTEEEGGGGSEKPITRERRDAETQWGDHWTEESGEKSSLSCVATEAPDYRWLRSTDSGRWFSPHTSSITAIEARQRQIREKCVEMNRRKKQQLVQNRQAMLRDAAEQARLAEEEAKKAKITWQLDLVLDCISIIEKERLITYEKAEAGAGRHKAIVPRFSCTEDVVTEILEFLAKECPMGNEIDRLTGKRDPQKMRKRKAQIVEVVIAHVLEESKKPVRLAKMTARRNAIQTNMLRAMTVQDVMQHVPKDTTSDVSSGVNEAATASSTSSPCPPVAVPTFFTKRRSMPEVLSSLGKQDPAPLPMFFRSVSAASSQLSNLVMEDSSHCSRVPSTAGSLGPNPSDLPPLFGTTKHAVSQGERPSPLTPASANTSTIQIHGLQAVGFAKHTASLLKRGLSAKGSAKFRVDYAEETPSWMTLPVKTASKSLAFACGLSSRGGFM